MNEDEIQSAYKKIKEDAERSGYNINPDESYAKGLVRGLFKNKERYGYESCPCRLASGKKEEDVDMICPCDYRDPDLTEYGTCFCALYVSNDIVSGKKSASSIPERRPVKSERQKKITASAQGNFSDTKFAYPVWRCKVCGYLCARDGAPEVCPICKASKERFERFA